MAEYTTDEEQVEAIKKWWSENGAYLVGGLALGLSLLVGWNYWKDHRLEQSQEASGVYSTLLSEGSSDERLATLSEDYSGTPYATLAQLQAAKEAVEKGELDSAEALLREAIAGGETLNLESVARIRLARVLLAAEKPEAALAEAEKVSSTAYLSLMEETRGDALLALGRSDEARKAYDKALLTASGRADFLQLKRDDLGPAPQDAS